MHAQHDNSQARELGLDASYQFKPGHCRQGQVNQRDVELPLSKEFKRLKFWLRFDQLAAYRIKHAFQAFPNDRVVVHKKHSKSRHGRDGGRQFNS
jgi:hypothetical protein